MTVTFTTTVEPDTPYTGNTNTVQEMVVSGTPTYRRLNRSRRIYLHPESDVGDLTSVKSLFYGTAVDEGPFDTKCLFGSADTARAHQNIFRPIGGPGGYIPPFGAADLIGIGNNATRITSYFRSGTGWDQTSISITMRDQCDFMGGTVANFAGSQPDTGMGSGPSGHLVSLAATNTLADWFYPTPTHLSMWGGFPGVQFAGENAYVMSSTTPTHPRNYIQPHLRSAPSASGSTYHGLGPCSFGTGMRMLEAAGYWIRPGTPIRPLVPWQLNGGGNGKEYADQDPSFLNLQLHYNHAAYGLPPIELSAAIALPVTIVTPPTIDLYLVQHKANGVTVTSPTVIASLAVPFDSFEPATAENIYLLQPTDSGHATTLDDDTVGFVFGTRLRYTLFGPTDMDHQGGKAWCKTPCHVQPWAMSSVVDGVSAYLPGSLYDPVA